MHITKKILICDDHILFLSGLVEILQKFGNDYTVITFNSSEPCKSFIQTNTVDVFICDLNIDNVDGYVLIEELKENLKEVKVIILSAYYEDYLINKAEKMGINAFLKKETTAEELISVIEMEFESPFYTNKSDDRLTYDFLHKDQNTINKFKLSKQEKEIIKYIIEGKQSKEIASLMFISKNTVDTHRKNINKKLKITNSSSLIKFAHENNLFN
ncbi:MAG: response regulator transcription factor [Flavobacterium sp.]